MTETELQPVALVPTGDGACRGVHLPAAVTPPSASGADAELKARIEEELCKDGRRDVRATTVVCHEDLILVHGKFSCLHSLQIANAAIMRVCGKQQLNFEHVTVKGQPFGSNRREAEAT